MKKIAIEGKFTGSVNNFVVLDVFRPNSIPPPYDFRKTYEESFRETLSDLEPDTDYNIDFTGFTTGQFELRISGEFEAPNPITDSFEDDTFSPGFIIHTEK